MITREKGRRSDVGVFDGDAFYLKFKIFLKILLTICLDFDIINKSSRKSGCHAEVSELADEQD